MESNFFRCWYYATNFCQSFFLLIVRLYWGFLFFMGAFFKLINMPAFIDFIGQFGMSGAWAYIITITELVCGVLIFFGFITRLSAAATAAIMLSAYIVAHPEQLLSFFRDPSYFFSAPPFSFLFASLVLLFFGPGGFSMDGILKKLCVAGSQSKKKKR
jgi:putative oxidoreductase